MPTGNLNSQLKEKLETLNVIPESFRFDSSAAWSRLETGLMQKKHTQT